MVRSGFQSLCVFVLMVTAAFAQNEATEGKWKPAVPLLPPGYTKPTQAVHTVLLKNNKLLVWDQSTAASEGKCDTLLVDLSTQPFTITCVEEANNTFPNFHRAFCGGHSQLADGRVLIWGGGFSCHGQQQRGITVYDPNLSGSAAFYSLTEEWGSPVEPTARWYPTVTTLAEGVLVTDGCHGEPGAPVGNADIPVLLETPQFDPATWTFNPLTSAEYPNAVLDYDLYTYPFMFLCSDGKVAICSQGYETGNNLSSNPTRKLDLALGKWVAGYGPVDSFIGRSACLLQFRDPNNPSTWREIVVKSGGNDEVEANRKLAAMLDLLDSGATEWTSLPSMQTARDEGFLLPLPSGEVLAVGGPKESRAEMWDPYDPQSGWRQLAPMPVARRHHSSAVVLPDGSVWFASGDSADGEPPGDPPDDPNSYSIYKPPYFFQGPRPTITSAPGAMIYNRGYNIDTPDADSITRVSLIRLGAATHGFDQNTRLRELEFTQIDGDTIRVSAPPSANHAPPGYYLLFICRDLQIGSPSHGRVPSAGHMLRLHGLFQSPPGP